MMWRLLPAFVFGVLAVPPLAASEAVTTEALPSVAVIAYGDRNAACLEWSDGCAVCARAPDGPHCSTPGIACQPAGIACRRRAD